MDHLIYTYHNSKFVKVNSPKGNPDRPNFVIVCELGDWSGFRTLAECERQFPDLEAEHRSNFFFGVVER